jgi:hypothetical protein
MVRKRKEQVNPRSCRLRDDEGDVSEHPNYSFARKREVVVVNFDEIAKNQEPPASPIPRADGNQERQAFFDHRFP